MRQQTATAVRAIALPVPSDLTTGQPAHGVSKGMASPTGERRQAGQLRLPLSALHRSFEFSATNLAVSIPVPAIKNEKPADLRPAGRVEHVRADFAPVGVGWQAQKQKLGFVIDNGC